MVKNFISKGKIDKIISIIVRTLKKNGIKRASIFGSYARGDVNESSDIDIIIEPRKGMGLFNFVGIKLELEKKLKKRVDLITYKSIDNYLRPYIVKEEVKIL